MDVPRSRSRFKLRQLRRRKPQVQFLVSGASDDSLCDLVLRYRAFFEACAGEMYDAVWPEWRSHRVVQVSLRFVGEAEMAGLNGSFRGVDAPTDVLTFPLFEADGRFVPPGGLFLPLALGDVALCPSVVRRNASGHGVSEVSELALVIFHGLLHLLAWDHATPEDEARMWSVQERFRDLLIERLDAARLPGES